MFSYCVDASGAGQTESLPCAALLPPFYVIVVIVPWPPVAVERSP